MTNPTHQTNKTDHAFISKRLRLAGTLIILGLVVERASLVWNHPLSFVIFVGLGGLLLFLGMGGPLSNCLGASEWVVMGVRV